MMDTEIERCTQQLLGAIRGSEEYREYVTAREEIEKLPDQKKAADRYRRKCYEEQNDTRLNDVEKMRLELSAEREELRLSPAADRYLRAEAVLCRMLRDVSIRVMNVPDLDIRPLEGLL